MPLKMNFKYKNKGDIRIYSSSKEMMPNALNSQHQYKKIYNIQIWNFDSREHIFQSSYIYFSFYSNVGINIIAKAEFEEEKSHKKVFRK